MNKHRCILFAVIPFICLSCQDKVDLEKEKEAIQSVIEAEIRASFYGDYKTWTSLFIHEPYAFCLHADNETCHYWKGWEEISSAATDFIRPERTAGRIYEGYYDYSVRVYEESALATFKTTTIIIRKGNEYDCELTGLEVRILEKQDGEWKITYLETVYSSDNP